jgi:hypothetical protein
MAVRDPHRDVRYHGRLGFTSQQRELLGRMLVFLAETLPAGVSWHQQVQLAGVLGVLSVPAELSSTECVRAGRDDLTCGTRPSYCRPSQKGRVRQVL